MDFDEQDEELQLHPQSYDSSRFRQSSGDRKPKYRECLKNHAVGLGSHAVDGCGEFLPAGEEGTLDALKCAACNCHRNFHRKELNGDGAESIYPHPFHPPQISPYYRMPACYVHPAPQSRPLALPSTSGGGDQDGFSNPSGGGGGGTGGSRKRFRTKFTVEQKDKMLVMAESIGWKIQKHDESVVQQFCGEMGIERHVFKVWMHNNKHTLGKTP